MKMLSFPLKSEEKKYDPAWVLFVFIRTQLRINSENFSWGQEPL